MLPIIARYCRPLSHQCPMLGAPPMQLARSRHRRRELASASIPRCHLLSVPVCHRPFQLIPLESDRFSPCQRFRALSVVNRNSRLRMQLLASLSAKTAIRFGVNPNDPGATQASRGLRPSAAPIRRSGAVATRLRGVQGRRPPVDACWRSATRGPSGHGPQGSPLLEVRPLRPARDVATGAVAGR